MAGGCRTVKRSGQWLERGRDTVSLIFCVYSLLLWWWARKKAHLLLNIQKWRLPPASWSLLSPTVEIQRQNQGIKFVQGKETVMKINIWVEIQKLKTVPCRRASGHRGRLGQKQHRAGRYADLSDFLGDFDWLAWPQDSFSPKAWITDAVPHDVFIQCGGRHLHFWQGRGMTGGQLYFKKTHYIRVKIILWIRVAAVEIPEALIEYSLYARKATQ